MSNEKRETRNGLKTFNENTKRLDIPDGAFEFTMPAELAFEAGPDDTRKLRLQLYDGSVQKHWYWGNFAFDLVGMKLAKKKIGILDSHDTSRRIGVAENAEFDGKFIVEGTALNNEHANAIIADADQGFPFEASLRFDPARSKAVYIREGQSVQVNGNTLTGPGTLFSKTLILEGSVCVFGALANCSTEAFEITNNPEFERKEQMSKDEITIESFKADHADLYDQIFKMGKAEGEKAERDMFKKIAELSDGDHELAVKCYTEGMTNEQTLMAKNEKLTKELAAAKNVAPEKKAEPPKVDPAKQEFSDDVSKEKAKLTGDVKEMTDEQLKERFAADKALQADYGDGEEGCQAFIAFTKADKAGQVSIKES